MKPLPVVVLEPSWPFLLVGLPWGCSRAWHGSQPTHPQELTRRKEQVTKETTALHSSPQNFNTQTLFKPFEPIKLFLSHGKLLKWIDRLKTQVQRICYSIDHHLHRGLKIVTLKVHSLSCFHIREPHHHRITHALYCAYKERLQQHMATVLRVF